MRREPEDGLLAPYDIEGQYRLHEALVRLGGVPVPGLRWLELDPSVLGMPFYVMDRVDGHVPVQWKPDDPIAFPDEAARRSSASSSSTRWRRSTRSTGARPGCPARATRSPTGSGCSTRPCWSRCRCCARRSPGCARTRRAPAASRSCHGDYRIGNFILGADRRIAAVLDWELAHVGDPVEDLAWAGLRLFRGRSALWSQLLPADGLPRPLRGAHRAARDAAVLRYFTVLCTLRAVIPYLRACRAFEEGRTSDLRLAAMGHQSIHVFRHLATELAA